MTPMIFRFLLIILVISQLSCYRTNMIKKDADNKPNIIFILADDLGWSDPYFMGNPVYESPNLDKMASEGIYFTNAYAPAANCAPSRACIMTGKNTPFHGIYTVGSSERGKKTHRKLIPTPNTKILADSFTTIAEVLRQNGYITASMGKWHLGESPLSQGFDLNVGGSQAGHPKSYFSPYSNINLSDGEAGEHLTDRLTDEAIKFIHEQDSKPFFLYLPYFAVHTPLQGKDSLVNEFKKKLNGDPRFNAKYGAMIKTMDDNIGRLMETIREQKIENNTLIIFMSDNGGLAAVSSQFPLRAGKGSYYEGGIRVPFIAKWPGKITAGQKSNIAITGMDIFPTILDIIGKEVDQKLDGNSLQALWTGDHFPADRSLIWHFPIYLQGVNPEKDEARDSLFRTRPGNVIRKDNWKLHEYFENDELELYKLDEDIGERINLASTYPEKTRELLDSLLVWRNKNNAPVPKKLNPHFKEGLE